MRNFKAIIQNKIDNSIFWEAWAETNEAAQSWIDQETLKVGKNIDPLWFVESDLSQEMMDKATEERVVDGVKEFLIPAQAEYFITDLTAQHDAEAAEAAEDAETLQQIKQAVSIINGWEQLSDININFLKKFFKYLIKKSI